MVIIQIRTSLIIIIIMMMMMTPITIVMELLGVVL